MSRGITAVLFFLSMLAAYTKYYQSFQNGFLDLLSDMKNSKSLPGLPGQLCFMYTGINPLDRFLTACNVFFWPIFQARVPELPLYGISFSSAMLPMWLIIVVETHRAEHAFTALVK